MLRYNDIFFEYDKSWLQLYLPIYNDLNLFRRFGNDELFVSLVLKVGKFLSSSEEG